MDYKRLSIEIGIGDEGWKGELTLPGAERVAPILGRAVDDRPPLHVNAVRQVLVALDAPRIRMARANFRLALRALADYRRRLFHRSSRC